MKRLVLLHMPFAEIKWSSLGLTQLQSVVKEKFEENFSVEIIYVNQTFAKHIGVDLYQLISSGPKIGEADWNADQLHGGIGDWYFRKEAFPELEDNAEQYFNRYFKKSEHFTTLIQEKQVELPDFLQNIIQTYHLEQADIVGFTSMFHQQFASLALARKLKELNPKIITVLGGAQISSSTAEVIADHIKTIDYVFTGPGLISFPKFLEYYLNEELDRVDDIPGVYSRQYKMRKDLTKETNKVGEERDINDVVMLDYTSFFDAIHNNFPDGSVVPELFYETSRGCWWGEKVKCTFCDYNGKHMHFRQMEPEKAIDYLNSLQTYASECKLLRSVDSIMPKNYIKEVFQSAKLHNQIDIFAEVRGKLNEEELRILKNAHVINVQAGIESFCTVNLQRMNKGLTAFNNIQFLKLCNQHGIAVLWNLLAGISFEDESIYETYEQYIPLFYHLHPPTGMWPISYDKNCDYSQNPSKYQLRLEPDTELLSYLYPFETAELEKLAYFYRNLDYQEVFTPKKMKKIYKINSLIQNWRKKWKEEDGKQLPYLYFDTDGKQEIVIDTRFDEKKVYRIDSMDRYLLKGLETPQKAEDILNQNPSVDKEIILNKIEEYIQHGFLFQENQRFISLIQNEKPIQPASNTLNIFL